MLRVPQHERKDLNDYKSGPFTLSVSKGSSNLDVNLPIQATKLACSNNPPIHFLRHVEVCAFLCQLLFEHLADMRVLVAVLDGVAALFDVEIQTPPIYTRGTLHSPRIAAQEGQHAQRFFRCAIVTVEPAGVAGGRAEDAKASSERSWGLKRWRSGTSPLRKRPNKTLSFMYASECAGCLFPR